MEKVPFLFCVHNHQPVGNFPDVLENAYQKAYAPFIQVLKNHPPIKVTVHYSGVLWDFFKKAHPEFLETLAGLTKAGQLEMMTGGYYEPILAVIPDEDKVGQIRRLTRTIQEEMDVTPRGMWLAERVWEPHLPEFLSDAGVEYITIDDYHFKKAGLGEKDLFGYYLTEENGKTVKVFPGSETLRYIIPFHPPEETLDYLSRLRGSSGAAIFADDGEKFGIWPYTYHSVYEEAWLEHLFQLIEKNLDWIEPMFMGTCATERGALGRIYLPTSSYMEMDEWSLPTQAMSEYEKVVERLKEREDGSLIRRFIKGGFWRNFFAKYPESNDLHKRIIHLRNKIRDEKREAILNSEEFVGHLYRAQCNDAYWHGVFGGLYLPHLRRALYENLIRAETLYDQGTPSGKGGPPLESVDFNTDGDEEFFLKNPEAIVLLSSRGGSLSEMDHREKAFNILASLTRREEGYHRKLLAERGERSDGKGKTIHGVFESKEKDLDQYLLFDRYRRTSFLDHFIAGPMNFEAFRRGRYEEEGDFIDQPYGVEIRKKGADREIIFSRRGSITKNGKTLPVDLEKRFVLSSGRAALSARYQITYHGKEKEKTYFGIEFNINLLAGDAPDRYYHIPGVRLEDRKLASLGESGEISEVHLIDEWEGIEVVLTSAEKGNLWRFPIYTVSLSEGGFEKIFQGSSLLLYWPLELSPGQVFTVDVELAISTINK